MRISESATLLSCAPVPKENLAIRPSSQVILHEADTE